MPHTETAILAGGCFWGVQDLLRALDGVIETRVGYTGGAMTNPSYEDVRTGRTDHAESLKIVFDPAVLSYRALLECFFQIHDPTTRNRQGNDIGTQYRSAIFFMDDVQKDTALALIAEMTESGRWPGPIVTQVIAAQPFYDAEDYHQDYLVKNPNGYTCHFVRADWHLNKTEPA